MEAFSDGRVSKVFPDPVVTVDMCRYSGSTFTHEDDDRVALFDEGVLPRETDLFVWEHPIFPC